MIFFLLGVVFSLALAALGYLVFRLRSAKPSATLATPSPPPPPACPPLALPPDRFSNLAIEQTIAINSEGRLRLPREQQDPFPRGLMNLESAIDLKKVLRGVSAIKEAEDARKRRA